MPQSNSTMSLEKKANAPDASSQGAGGCVGNAGEKNPSVPSVSDPFLSSSLDDKTDLKRRRSEKYRECRRRESEWGELHGGSGGESGSLEAGTELKERGNAVYARGDYQGALGLYWEALEVLPWITPPSLNLVGDDKGSGGDKANNKSEGGAEAPAEEGGTKASLPPVPLSPLHTLRSVCHCNRAACFATQEKWECALWDCDRALEINPSYSKALARRGAVLEKLDLLDDALTDYKALIALDPGKASSGAKKDEERVLKLIQARDEKLKVSGGDVDRGEGVLSSDFIHPHTYLTYATTFFLHSHVG